MLRRARSPRRPGRQLLRQKLPHRRQKHRNSRFPALTPMMFCHRSTLAFPSLRQGVPMMKKILVLAAVLLLVAAACTMQPTSNNGATSNANTSAAKAPMVSDAEIIAKEKSGWDAVKKKDWDAFGKLLASDYIQVLDDGVYDKARTLSAIKDFDLSDATLSDWKTIPVNKDAMIVTYSSTVKATYKGQAAPAGPYREAAAYVNRHGESVAIFYQETLATTPRP